MQRVKWIGNSHGSAWTRVANALSEALKRNPAGQEEMTSHIRLKFDHSEGMSKGCRFGCVSNVIATK